MTATTVVPRTPKGRARRSELLLAARRVFERSGYFDVRVADIAAEAGVAYGTFYRYFESKDAVLRALVEEVVDDLFRASTERPADGDEDLVLGSVRAFLRAYRAQAAMMRVLEQVMNVSPEFLLVRNGIKDRFASALEAAIRAAQERGHVDLEIDPLHAAYALGGMVQDSAYSLYVLRQPSLDEDTLARTLARLWSGALSVRR